MGFGLKPTTSRELRPHRRRCRSVSSMYRCRWRSISQWTRKPVAVPTGHRALTYRPSHDQALSGSRRSRPASRLLRCPDHWMDDRMGRARLADLQDGAWPGGHCGRADQYGDHLQWLDRAVSPRDPGRDTWRDAVPDQHRRFAPQILGRPVGVGRAPGPRRDHSGRDRARAPGGAPAHLAGAFAIWGLALARHERDRVRARVCAHRVDYGASGPGARGARLPGDLDAELSAADVGQRGSGWRPRGTSIRSPRKRDAQTCWARCAPAGAAGATGAAGTPGALSLCSSLPYRCRVCRSIKTLRQAEVVARDDEINDAAWQVHRKVSGFREQLGQHQLAFEGAVDEIALASQRLLASITENLPHRS